LSFSGSRLSAVSFRLAVAFALAGMAVPVRAQTVMNPTTANFTASTDHNTTGSNGLPMVDHYELEFYNLGASAPFQIVSLGKPTPDGTGTISVNFSSLLGTPLAAGPTYTADVAAVGSGGRGTSAMSVDTFAYTAPACTYTLSAATLSIVAAGGTASVTVTTGAGCTWTAADNATWLTVTSGASGSGNGTVTVTATANPTTASRSATLTVGGKTVTVTQAAPCSYSLSPATQNIVAAGGTGSVAVTTSAGCAWTATDNATWLSETSGASGSGNGTVTVTATANTTTASRSVTVTIGGQTVTVTQPAPATTPTSPANLRITG
jgi:hypothetical protein